MRSELLIILCFFAIAINGQTDTLLTGWLDSITVWDTKPTHGVYLEHDQRKIKLLKEQNLGHSLQKESDLYIRNYGPGSIATISILGGNASQTQVVWNGLNINHPMLGLSDMSLIPPIAIDKLSLIEGTATPMIGNGTIGGAVILQNDLNDLSNQTQFKVGFGSFRHLEHSIRKDFQRSKWSLSSRVWHQYAKNDFQIQELKESREQSNAKTQQVHYIQNIRYHFSPSHKFKIDFWAFDNQRQIPPLLTQNKSLARQNDHGIYTTLSHSYLVKRNTIHTQFGLTSHQLRYIDPLQGVEAPSHVKTYSANMNYEHRWKSSSVSHQFGGEIETKYLTAKADGYKNTENEWRTSLMNYYRLQLADLSIHTGLRLAKRATFYSPLCPEIQISFSPNDLISFQYYINRGFRFPALNDLYWGLGGNADLLPEEGWGHQFSNQIQLINGKWIINAKIHHRLINNWILWAQNEGDLFFSASNIAQVRSYGINIKNNFNLGHLSIKNIELSINYLIDYNWIKSIHEKSYSLPKLTIGEQLTYTPEHKLTNSITAKLQAQTITLSHRYYSSTLGINENIDSYQLLDFIYSYQSKIFSNSTKINFKIENILNRSYQVIERRPMPGINYLLTLQLNIK